MYSLRRWLYRPKRSDSSLLAQFYFADEELNLIAAELDSFEGRKDPERCTAMVNQLRACQARVLTVVSQMMDETVKEHRAPRDFRVKFPDDVIQENLAGQLWFGAECLAAGSCIMNREVESACMRPLARALTKNLDSLRTILREQCLQSVHDYTETIKESLIIFDKLFAEFELSYVSAMVPVKTAHEYDMIQEITVLFSETVQRALKIGLLTIDMIDEYDPALMFTIPRLAIVCGVLIFKDGPLNPDNDPWNISEMFRPFQTLLLKIRELLTILTEAELITLERALCSQEEPSFLISLEEKKKAAKRERQKNKEDKKKRNNKKLESEGDDGSVESELTALEIAERLEALALNFEASRAANNVPPDQAEPDSQSKSSEASSESTSSLLSEGDADTGSRVADVEDVQLQRFTNQLYYEANLDSQSIYEDALARPLSAFSQDPEFVHDIPPQDSPLDSSSSTVHTPSEAAGSFSIKQGGHKELGMEEAADETSKDLPVSTIVKCNSNDSGLHSEVVSNSGSMFTISSSDSNHQMTSPDTPTLPESFSHIQNFQDHGSAELNESSAITDLKDSGSQVKNGIRENAEEVGRMDGMEGQEQCNKTQTDKHDYSDAAAVSLAVHEDKVTVQDCFNSNDHSERSNCAMSNANLSKIDTGQEENQNLQSVVVSNPSDKTQQEMVSSNQSNNAHSPSCDNYVSQVNSHSLCQTSIQDPSGDSLSSSQNGNEKTHLTSSSNNLCAQSESREEVVVGQSCSPSVGETTAGSPDNSNLNVELNNNSTPKSSSMSTENNCTSPAVADRPSAANSSAGAEPSQQKPCNHSTAGAAGAGVSQASSTASVAAKSSVPTKRDGIPSSSRIKGKLKRTSGVKGKRTSMPSRTKTLVDDQLLDGECCNSSETSSYTSDCGDQEEIALAIEAVESATRQQVRARFRSSSDMIHRLFVCISGVADQLQTNFAGDLRNILRSVFDMNCSEPIDITDGDKCKETTPLGAAYIAISNASRNARRNRSATNQSQAPPVWVPDEESTECMSCQVPFSFVRRRHHCRNCGKIFCSRCSSNFVPLPHFGQEKCVRVCNRCFMFRVTPFTVRSPTQ